MNTPQKVMLPNPLLLAESREHATRRRTEHLGSRRWRLALPGFECHGGRFEATLVKGG